MKVHYLNNLLDYLKLNAKQFSESLGFDRVDRIYNVLNFKNRISSNLAKIITNHYPDVNYDWLLTGKGEMLNRRSINITGQGNIANTGTISNTISGTVIGRDNNNSNIDNSENKQLMDKILKLENRIRELENDKIILQEFITFLQNKK